MDTSISVIIPVYNGEAYLREAIDSVLNQTYRPSEILIIDDGSTDNSASIAQSYPSICYIYQINQGVSAARNVGIQAAQGKFIAFLDADDMWTPNKLEVQLSYLLKHPHIGYTFTKQRILLEPGREVPAWFREDLLLEDHPGFVPSTLVVRKKIFEQVGYFNSKYRRGEDTEWLTRARNAGISMAVIPETLLLRRMHDHNLSLGKAVNYSQLLGILKGSIDRKRIER